MNSFRNGFYFLGAIILLVCIGVIIWYALVYSQRPNVEENGTLAVEWQIKQRSVPRGTERYLEPWSGTTEERQVTL